MTKCDGACFSAARTGIAAEIFVCTSFSSAVFVLSVIWNTIAHNNVIANFLLQYNYNAAVDQ